MHSNKTSTEPPHKSRLRLLSVVLLSIALLSDGERQEELNPSSPRGGGSGGLGSRVSDFSVVECMHGSREIQDSATRCTLPAAYSGRSGNRDLQSQTRHTRDQVLVEKRGHSVNGAASGFCALLPLYKTKCGETQQQQQQQQEQQERP